MRCGFSSKCALEAWSSFSEESGDSSESLFIGSLSQLNRVHMLCISPFINDGVWSFHKIQNFVFVLLSIEVTFKDILKAIGYWNEENTAFGFTIKFMSISHKATFALYCCFLVLKEVSTFSKVCRREAPLCFSAVWRAEGSTEGQIWHNI